MKEQISGLPEVKSVLDNSGIGNRELHLELKSKAYLLGLNEMAISNQIRQATNNLTRVMFFKYLECY